VIIEKNSSIQKFSFWADNESDEEYIWKQFLDVIRENDDFTLFHYGSYEREFIEKMRKRYSANDEKLIENLKSHSINILSLLYANIYFPTYSNSLKDIGAHLGAKWSIAESSGLTSLIWRYKWESSKDTKFKQKLVQYNIEDCDALKITTKMILNILNNNEGINNENSEVILAENIQNDLDWLKFGESKFALEDLEFINKCAYFDYQRDKVFFRTSNKNKKLISQKTNKIKKYHTNKEIEISIPKTCPRCNGAGFHNRNKKYKTVFDLKLLTYGIKQWIVQYSTRMVKCKSCGFTFQSDVFTDINSRYGVGLKAWIVYQIVALKQPYRKVEESLRVFFNYDLLERTAVYRAKSEMAKYYSETYKKILSKLRAGQLMHADETTVNIQGVDAYVWVFTSLEEVLYVYHPTREGTILEEILQGFHGVLVSDFYNAYDSYNGPQQKCIIHLIRDMNNDLLKNPFDEQYKIFIKEFSILFRKIVATIDEYGLKKKYLNRHKNDAEQFFDKYLSNKFESEILNVYKKRFTSNRTKLFTFLDYDGVPWNNNNAEHAIKGFAAYRKTSDGSFTEKGIKEYLTLLSIHKTCEYQTIDFLQFLLSGETDLDKFASQKRKRYKVPALHTPASIRGYPLSPGQPALSMTCHEGLTTLPGHGQLVDL